MAKTFSELQALALQIRDEILEKKNTAPRVGAALLDMIDNTIQNITDINQKLSVFEHACSGFKRVESESQLPVTPPEDEKAVGYLVGKNLYLFVGKNGNAANGRYFNVGSIIGPQGEIGPQGIKGLDGKDGVDGKDGRDGERGPQGNSGITGSASDIDVINDLSGGESTPGSIKVLAAAQGPVIDIALKDSDPETLGQKIQLDYNTALYTDGTIHPLEGFATSDYVSINPLSTIRCNLFSKHYERGLAIITEYDESRNCIDYWTQTDSHRAITLNSKTRYIKICVDLLMIDRAYVFGNTEGHNLLSLMPISKSFSNVCSGLTTLNEGFRLSEHGEILYDDNFAISDMIPVNTEYVKFGVHTKFYPETAGFFIYDEDFTYLDYWAQTVQNRTVRWSDKPSLDKNKIKYIRICVEKSMIDYAYVLDDKGNNLLFYSTKYKIYELEKKIKSSINGLSSDIIISGFPRISGNIGYLKDGDDVNGYSLNSFLLKALGISDNYKFLHISDTHGTDISLTKMSDMLKKDSSYMFGIITGDLTLTESMKKIIQDNDKILLLLGNHDTADSAGNNQKTARDNFIAPYMQDRAIMGDDENIASYWYKDINNLFRIIAFDEYEYTRVGLPHSGSTYSVVYSKKQIDWFISLLRNTPKDMHIIIMVHQPPSVEREDNTNLFVSENAPNIYEYEGSLQDTALLIPRIIDAYSNKKVFSGTFKCGDAANTTMTFDENFTNIDQPAKFLFYVGGHTHWDVCEYLPLFPEQLMLIIDQAKPQKYTYSDLPRDTQDSAYCINEISMDIRNKKTTVTRFGAKNTEGGKIRNYITFPFEKA